MTVQHPLSLFAAYLFAAAAVGAGVRLWRSGRSPVRVSVMVFAGSFTAVAVAAAAGETARSLIADLGGVWLELLWHLAVLAVGVTAFCLLVGVILAGFSGAWRRLLLPLAGVGLIAYTFWVPGRSDVGIVAIVAVVTLLTLAALELSAWIRTRATSPFLILSGVAASLIAISFLRLERNVLYYAVQLVGLLFFYRGASRLEDRLP